MSSKKIAAITISLLLLLPVCKSWISYLISTYEDYVANENQEEKTILIDDEVETIDAKEEEDDSPEITDKETDEHVSQKDQNKLASQNNVETQDPASKKEKKQDAHENQEKHKTKKSDIVDVADSPLKFRTLYNGKANVIEDRSYQNLTSITIPAKIRDNGDVYTVTNINSWVFHYCENLVNIEIPSTITEINLRTLSYRNMKKLTNITVASDNPS